MTVQQRGSGRGKLPPGREDGPASSARPSPRGARPFPALPAIAGVGTATTSDGSYRRGRPNVLLVEVADGTTVAGMLTRSKTRSAPVEWCATALAGGVARALVANAGNANAFTGRAGRRRSDTPRRRQRRCWVRSRSRSS